MIDFESCFSDLAEIKGFKAWLKKLPEQIKALHYDKPHGDMPKWEGALERLPKIKPSVIDLNCSSLKIGSQSDLNEAELAETKEALQALIPWKKGPFSFFDIHIDAEWRSDWKWERIQNHISPLKGRTVLDVGCGSGYHLWRMYGEGARLSLGIDPSRLFMMQFQSVKQYLGDAPVHFLPLRLEDLPQNLATFDSVFSMGVLYHRRSPLDHILELKSALKSGGELILETLVIDDPDQKVLFPKDRYAMMPNVYFLPSVTLLSDWLKRCGFQNIKVADLNQTSLDEQRATDWMQYKSLKDFLDPEQSALTIEGYPAPLRATLIAEKPHK